MRNLKSICAAIIFLTGIMLTHSCTTPQKKIAGDYKYETECMGIEMDGSQTLKAWGTGKDKADAVEQAKKNAVSDVLFKGIRNGKTECEVKPVLFEVNVREKNEDYFNKFFTDGGAYKEFTSAQDESAKPKNFKSASSDVTYSVIVRVLRPQLKEKMMNDKIINQ